MARTATTQTTAVFGRDSEGGWGVYVPADAATVGATVTVTKRDGTTKTVTLTEVWPEDTDKAGRTWARFDDGVPATRRTSPLLVPEGVNPWTYVPKGHATAPARAQGTRGRCDNCGDHKGGLTAAVDSSGISGMVCRPCSREARWDLSFA